MHGKTHSGLITCSKLLNICQSAFSMQQIARGGDAACTRFFKIACTVHFGAPYVRQNTATAQHPTCRRQGAPDLLCYFFAISYTVRMVAKLTLIVRPQDEHNDSLLRKKACEQLAQKNIRVRDDEVHLVCIKKSIDARHGNVKLCLKYNAYIGEEAVQNDALPKWKHADGKRRIIIVGAGPAGLFGALRLLEDGITPVLVERGTDTVQRKKDIAAISTQHIVDANSNYCFGEGGAGTFSDGKLYTRSAKRGNVPRILHIFNHFGADECILKDAHPHIGTDKLPKIINAMREKIITLGGEFHFNMKCIDLLIAHDEAHSGNVCGIVAQHTKTGERLQFIGDAVLFATGHSASDIYKLLANVAPHALEAKPFALGVRVEHPRALIDAIQYHGKQLKTAAEYRLATHVDGRGVYSFCMCPGGFVVPSSTGNDEIVVNGMSSAGRNSAWSNAAIVVETTHEDIPLKFVDAATADGCPALAGLYWRTHLECEAKNAVTDSKRLHNVWKIFLRIVQAARFLLQVTHLALHRADLTNGFRLILRADLPLPLLILTSA